MISVLFDTPVVSYWHSDHPTFRGPLQQAFRSLDKKSSSIAKFVSAITVQELMVWAIHNNAESRVQSFLRQNFSPPIPLDDRAARCAAELQATTVSRIQGKSGADRDHVKNVWFRDAAIVGTAEESRIDYLVTTDTGIERYYNHLFTGDIILVRSDNTE